MEAEDTVMSEDEIRLIKAGLAYGLRVTYDAYRDNKITHEEALKQLMIPTVEQAVAKAQAEISFKAGIKEVVDSPIYLAAMGGQTTIKSLFSLHPEGEAKLKEWGTEDATPIR